MCACAYACVRAWVLIICLLPWQQTGNGTRRAVHTHTLSQCPLFWDVWALAQDWWLFSCSWFITRGLTSSWFREHYEHNTQTVIHVQPAFADVATNNHGLHFSHTASVTAEASNVEPRHGVHQLLLADWWAVVSSVHHRETLQRRWSGYDTGDGALFCSVHKCLSMTSQTRNTRGLVNCD